MTIPKKPKLDAWYKDEEGRSFNIVAIDENDGTIEIQYFDGDITEIDVDTWYELDLRSIAEPETGSGPFDDLDLDDPGAVYRTSRAEDWDGPVDEIDFEE